MNSSSDLKNQLPNMQGLNEQTINDIQNLQSIEINLYNTLENNLNNQSLTTTQKNDIINKINEVSQLRIKLYNNLTTIYSAYQSNVSNADILLNEKMQSLKIVEEQLNTLRLRLNKIQNINSNKMRLVQINTYYGKKYDAYVNILKDVIIISFIILVISILKKTNILPENIYYLFILILFFIAVITLSYKFYDISLRDNMNFDEYNWRFTPPSYSSSSTTTTTGDNVWGSNNSNICSGNECCQQDQDYWDSTLNKCVPIPVSTTTSQENTDVTDIFGNVDLSTTKNCNFSSSTETFKSSPFSYF